MILLTKDKCWIINVKIVQQELYGLSDTESILIYINLCLLSFLKKKHFKMKSNWVFAANSDFPIFILTQWREPMN